MCVLWGTWLYQITLTEQGYHYECRWDVMDYMAHICMIII